MSNKIAKSPEMLQKEAAIKDLRSQLKKRQSTLKSLKTRLKNTQTEIETINRRAHSETLRKMEEMDALRMEIAELARQLKKVKGMSRMDKEQLQMMADEMGNEEMFGPGYKDYKEFKAQRDSGNFNFDEYERARMNNMFQEFQVKPAAKELKDIRKVFLKLSQKFHPDLAKDEREAEEFHSLMQQINEAYQHNDVQALLELESMYLLEELDFSVKAVTVDVLQQEIDRLNRDLVFIEQQIGRTSEEIQNLRASDLGRMLTSMNRADREGQGFDHFNAQFDNMIDMFTKLRDGLIDSIQERKISPKLMDLLMGQEEDFDEEEDFPHGANPMDLLMRLMEGDEEAFDMLNDFYEDEMMVENPKFPIGSSVRVKSAASSPHDRKVKMQGWTGRVNEAYYNERNQVVYDVSFDSVTIQQMPPSLIRKVLEMGEDFQDIELLENQLEACRPRDKFDDAVAAYRTAYHQYLWPSLTDPAQAKRLKDILLRYPVLTDEQNWDSYFDHHLKFPFNVTTKGTPFIEEGIPMQVTGIETFDNDAGHLVNIQMLGQRGKKKKQLFPLLNLNAADPYSPTAQILEDYDTWASEMLGF